MITRCMMKNLTNIFILFSCLLTGMTVNAQIGNYTYKRKIDNQLAEWHKISLPEDIYQKIQVNLADLRIYGINETGDTIEAGYIIEETDDEIIQTEQSFTMLNEVKKDQVYYYTFKPDKKVRINEIALNFSLNNFDWKINLLGSNDNENWYTILENYRIVSIQNEKQLYTFSTLFFKTTEYAYYQVQIAAKENPNLQSAKITHTETKSGIFKTYSNQLFIYENKENNQTEITVQLKELVPVNRISIHSSSSFDFYRDFDIEILRDSTKTEKGYIKNYENIYHGIYTSIHQPAYVFECQFAQELRIIIHNGNNPAINIDSVEVSGFTHELLVRFTEPADYYFYYGNQQASLPDYDLQHFVESIPSELTYLTLGAEEITAQATANPAEPFFKNKAWLWVLMGLVILILGWFSVKMLSKKGN